MNSNTKSEIFFFENLVICWKSRFSLFFLKLGNMVLFIQEVSTQSIQKLLYKMGQGFLGRQHFFSNRGKIKSWLKNLDENPGSQKQLTVNLLHKKLCHFKYLHLYFLERKRCKIWTETKKICSHISFDCFPHALKGLSISELSLDTEQSLP